MGLAPRLFVVAVVGLTGLTPEGVDHDRGRVRDLMAVRLARGGATLMMDEGRG